MDKAYNKKKVIRLLWFLLSLFYNGLLLFGCIHKNTHEHFVATKEEILIEKASVGSDGNIHIFYTDKSSHVIEIDKRGGWSDLQISPDKKTIGWIVGSSICYDEENSKYTIVKSFNDCGFQGQLIEQDKLFIFHAGQQIKVADGIVVGPWQFWDNGKKIAYLHALMHGPNSYALYDIEKDEIISDYTSYGEKGLPAWAKGIEVDH